MKNSYWIDRKATLSYNKDEKKQSKYVYNAKELEGKKQKKKTNVSLKNINNDSKTWQKWLQIQLNTSE